MLTIRSLPTWKKTCLSIAAVLMAASNAWAIDEVEDEDLSAVAGGDGVTIIVQLVWNANRTQLDLSSKVSIGFKNVVPDPADPVKTKLNETYLVYGGFGGGMELIGLKIDALKGPPDIGDYVSVTLPSYIGFDQFGFQSMSVQASKDAVPSASYGQWLLNGSAVVSGNVYIWPAK